MGQGQIALYCVVAKACKLAKEDTWHMQADASMRVHMLERELARAQKDIVALRCQLRCQSGTVANPAVLRAAAAVSL